LQTQKHANKGTSLLPTYTVLLATVVNEPYK